MPPKPKPTKLRTVPGSYAVLWEHPRGLPTTGRLSLGPHTLSLHGRNRNHAERLELPYRDLCAARRSETRIGVLPAIEIDCRDRDTITLASLDQPGTRSEILGALQRIVSAQA